MSNNVAFISSIKNEKDFEEIVRMLAKHIYDAEAYLVGGPYDGGRDLIYKRQGKEVKEAIQISIQENKIEAKILEDARKTEELVKKHGYPNTLTFFWSRALSASKKLDIKKSVRNETGVSLEIYDATEIDQIVSNDRPDILKYLLEVIHKYKADLNQIVDIKARTFFDYLALSGESAELKTSIIDAQILSSLFGDGMKKEQLLDDLDKANVRKGTAEGRITYLIRQNKIELSDVLALSEKEKIRLGNIINKDDRLRQELLERIKQYTLTEIGTDLSKEVFDLVKEVYRASVDIQISEISFEPPKLYIAKKVVSELESLIAANNKKGCKNPNNIAKKLIEIAAENEYLSNYCSSLLCVNLLNQKKLQSYIQEKFFFIYLDATVFIQYLALFGFKDHANHSKEMHIAANLREAIRGLKNVEVRITQEHLEESIRHITQAEKLSSFANDELISQFGDSKNVYFNLYLKTKKQNPQGYSFDNFLDSLIGYEVVSNNVDSFHAYMNCVLHFLKIANIKVAELNNAAELEHNAIALKIIRNYEQSCRKSRKFKSILNDLTACYILGDNNRHLDQRKCGHVPILITWDSTQHELRSAYREIFMHQEWLIYTPQRALERISMLDFKMGSDILKDSVLSILDEDYLRDSSLVDTLAIFLGEDNVESDAIISVLAKLSGKLSVESIEHEQFDLESRNAVNEALVSLHNTFRYRLGEIRQLFASSSNQDELIQLLNAFVSRKIDSSTLNQSVEKLVQSLNESPKSIS